MPLIRETIKAKIKAKIDEMRNLEDDADTDDLFAELFLILLDELKQNAVVTGICASAGSSLRAGKIT